jgi:hypothetical protein
MTYESSHFTLAKNHVIMIVSKYLSNKHSPMPLVKLFVNQHINITRHVIDQKHTYETLEFSMQFGLSMTKNKQLSLN